MSFFFLPIVTGKIPLVPEGLSNKEENLQYESK